MEGKLQEQKSGIHPTALVHPEARIGSNVAIGPHSIIGPAVEIGNDTQIGAHVVLENTVRIGRENRIFHGAVIGSAPQDLKYKGDTAVVELGDRNTIREYVTVNIATTLDETTKIGNDCLLMAYSHVAHNCLIGDSVIMANSVNLAGHVQVDDHAIMGGLAAVHQFVVIGAHSFIGGLARVSQDVPPYTKVAGLPPRPSGINSVGLERRGFSEEQIARVKEAYRFIYRRGLRREEALQKILAAGDDEIAATFQSFFERSQRGIVR